MSLEILMPALSPTMTEGNINKWLVKVGDKVKAGDIIAEIETDKATMEVEAVDEGIITHLIDTDFKKKISVNSVIAIIDGKKEELIDSFSENSKKEIKSPNAQSNFIEPNTKKIKKDTEISKSFKASPYAKSLIKELNISPDSLNGTGPMGRIIKRDLVNLNKKDKDDFKILRDHSINKPSSIRNIIAEKTTKTKQSVPHFYLTIESNVGNLINLRSKINSSNNNNKVSFNDLIVKALSLAMKKNPKTNASWINGDIYTYSSIDVSIAVSLEEGLITPVIKDADKKGINEISLEIRDLIKKAKENKLMPEEYSGGSISISNLGMFGITEFSAIINNFQSSILAVGSIQEKPIVENGKIKVGNILKSTLSVDHRVLDGAVAAKLLKDFSDILENPFSIWLESNDLEII